MPSPFPGMDPYLETGCFFDGFRHGLLVAVSAALNQCLPESCFSELAHRTEVVPMPDAAAVEVLGSGESVSVLGPAVEDRVAFVEVRDARSGHELLTVIEVLSPSNKRPPGDENRDAYDRKRRDLLDGGVSLVELDLLRSGDRGVLGEAALAAQATLPGEPEYVALVTRGHVPRPPTPRASLFPFWIEKPLPAIPIPIGKGRKELPLPLQPVFDAAYDAGPYRRVLKPYPKEPQPPLPAGKAEWLAGVLGDAA